MGPEGGINGNPHKEKDEVTTKSIKDNAPEQGSPKRVCLTPLADASNPIMAQVWCGYNFDGKIVVLYFFCGYICLLVLDIKNISEISEPMQAT